MHTLDNSSYAMSKRYEYVGVKDSMFLRGR